MQETEVPCKTHPDAPHGFLRNASHTEDRYVCECEYWTPPSSKKPQLPEADIITDLDWCENQVYYSQDMLKFQQDTINACYELLLESGYKSNGVSAYEELANKIRNMK